MKIYSICDKEFKEYGDVIEENFSELLMELAKPRVRTRELFTLQAIRNWKTWQYIR